ncbi:MAG: hypothetical protein H7A46_04925 [Verrucomicrobiales bacterium]|nr:hypothetical protein [Verrucomicrobiales bacterium]
MTTLLKYALWILGAAQAVQPVLWALDPPADCDICQCTKTMSWQRPVDLDGDEVPDFDHIRLRDYKYCDYVDWWAWQDDEIEAFYPQTHVDVYVDYSRGRETRVRAALPPGRVIEVDPQPVCPWGASNCWEWVSRVPDAQAILDAEGLGTMWRLTDRYPCPPEIINCMDLVRAGEVRLADPSDQTAEALFGFRIQQADGWHLGWIRLLLELPWPESFDERPVGGISLLEYAIHPIPETPIVAGEYPRPKLEARIEKDEVILSWQAAWTGYVLERSSAVTGGAWEPVPGVENNSVRVSKAGPPAFFRLKQE